MANHKSAIKKIRADEKKRLRNRYQLKTARTFVRRLKEQKDKTKAVVQLSDVASLLDKLAKNNIIHWKNAANHKSALTKRVNALV